MYDGLAIIYDSFTEDIDYKAWAKDICDTLKANGVEQGKRVVDLACGTGHLTCLLAKNGYSMVGIDISDEMLLRAGENMRKSGVSFPLSRQNISNFTVGKKAEAVICTCDGVNYLTKDEDLKGFLRCCKNALKEKGVLIFDISSDRKLKEVLGNNECFDIRDDACIFWRNNQEGNLLFMELNIFIKEPDGRYIRKTEEQVQRCYSKEEILKHLTDFEVLEVRSVSYDDLKKDERLQFICRLKEDK